jgi:hypothetical protein
MGTVRFIVSGWCADGGGCVPRSPGSPAVPIAGPFIYVGAQKSEVDLSPNERRFFIADGITQAAGASLVILGAALKAAAPRRSRVDVVVAPLPVRSASGLSIAGVF